MQTFLVAPEHVYDSPDPDDRRQLTAYYLASEIDARIAEHIKDWEDAAKERVQHLTRIADLERALHQIKNGCVDDDDVANELFSSSPCEIRKICEIALAGGPVP